MTSDSLNSSGITNQTFDFYCINEPFGPLVWGIFSVISSSVGMPASLWLTWIIIRRHHKGYPSNVYISNLAVMDLLFNLCQMPCVLNYIVWRVDKLFTFLGIVFYFNYCGRPFLTAAMCVEGYMAVVHPIAFANMKNRRHRIVVAAVMWLLTLSNYAHQISLVIIFISQFLSAPVITYCNVSVLYALKGSLTTEGRIVHPQKQKALQIVAYSLFVSLLCYPTFLGGYVYYLFNLNQHSYCFVYFPTLITCNVASTITPWMYLSNLGNLRNTKCTRHKSGEK